MPNADGSPTLQELMAANPGMGASAPPPPAPAPMSGPSLQEQLASRGIAMGGPAPNAPPPQGPSGFMPGAGLDLGLAKKFDPNAAAHMNAEQPNALMTSLAPQVVKGPAAGGGAPAGKPVVYQPKAGGPGSLQDQTAQGFQLPPGTMGGGGGAPNPNAVNMHTREIDALAQAQARNEETRMMGQSDTQFQREMSDRDVKTLTELDKTNAARAKAHGDALTAQKDNYLKVLNDKPNESIDSGRFWRNASTGQKLVGILAGIFGGFAQSLNHTASNTGLDAINKLVDDDIAEQRANIANAKDERKSQLEGQGQIYGMMRDQFHDDDVAADLSKAFVYDRMAVEGKQRALLTQDVNIQKQADEAANAFGQKSAQLQDDAAARRAAMMVKGGGGGVNPKEWRETIKSFVEKGDDQATAEMRAARLFGLTRQGANLGTLENGPAKKGIEEKQVANDEANANFNRITKSPVLNELGLGQKVAGMLPSAIAPGANKTAAQLQALNLEMIGSASKVLKDNEGRIPPAVLDRLHELEITPGMTPDQARAQVTAMRDFVNSLALQGGSKAPTPNVQAPLMAQVAGSFKPAGAAPSSGSSNLEAAPSKPPLAPGQVAPGNIDLLHRPVVHNKDGSISTVRSIGINVDGKEVLIPTVSPDGKVLSNAQAVQLFRQTGQHLGVFDSPKASTDYALQLHNQQADYYGNK